MRPLLAELLEAHDQQVSATFCRIVETRGSTPQKAGAAMLVFADGTQRGTLGGGCVEAEVKRRALAALDGGGTSVLRLSLDHDYGWDDGLICGGRMHVLIEPVTAASNVEYFRTLHQMLISGQGCVEAIVFGSEPAKPASPAAYLFDAQGAFVASLTDAGETPSHTITAHLPDLATRPLASAGNGVAYLPSLPRCRLIVVGAGHVGQAVARLAAETDFDVWVVDDRHELLTPERFPAASRLLHGPLAETLDALPIDPHAYALIVTRGHSNDEQALFRLVNRGGAYVGMIGSRRKIKLIFDDLAAVGVSADALERVYAPVGLAIGSQTVPEIAISIVAELIAHRNLNGRVPGKEAPAPTRTQFEMGKE